MPTNGLPWGRFSCRKLGNFHLPTAAMACRQRWPELGDGGGPSNSPGLASLGFAWRLTGSVPGLPGEPSAAGVRAPHAVRPARTRGWPSSGLAG